VGRHIKVLVCSSAQLVQPINLSTPVCMLWLLEGSHFGFVSDELGGGRDVTWGVHCCYSHHSWCWMFEGIVGRLCQLGHPFILTNCVSHLYQVNREGYSSIEQGSYHHC